MKDSHCVGVLTLLAALSVHRRMWNFFVGGTSDVDERRRSERHVKTAIFILSPEATRRVLSVQSGVPRVVCFDSGFIARV
jgi:hypothetical protein